MARYERFMVTKFNPELVEEANVIAKANNIPIPEGGILGTVLRVPGVNVKGYLQVIKAMPGNIWILVELRAGGSQIPITSAALKEKLELQELLQKTTFLQSWRVAWLAERLAVCLRVKFHMSISWETMKGFLWKCNGSRIRLQKGMAFGDADVLALAEFVVNHFDEYFMIKLR